ncbi:hypothetical protein [uncultured Erythrobacter sp.]|uniref:hypothetical protein n=1 Tax=uncultured Erythrobacter sp. TaxID=263913 RepID=UPI002657EC55|nr:hypothetical protein [uncultured Erythrobacter sp.]
MLYPNRLQAALLFDRRIHDLEAIMRDFVRIEGMRSSVSFHLSETNPGLFYRLFDATDELMVTFEYVDRPANAQVFQPALSSVYTGIVTPDIRERITRCDSHILVEVSHGVMAGVEENPEIAAMFEAIGRERSGASQPQFERRLAALALITRIAIDHAMPLAVHWTQSDTLLSGEMFDRIAAGNDAPGPLHIHPFLFGPTAAPGESARVGIRTFGARHWLGREIIVQPNVLPWAANLETIFAFLRVTTMPNGYVIPDGDTFGPEDRSLSYRVLHHDARANIGYASPEPADVPFYELVPLKHLQYGFVADEHVPDANAFDDRAFPLDIMPEGQDERMALANEWFEKRKLAEGIGGRFEVRKAGEGDAPLAPEPPTRVIAPTPSQPGLPGLTGRGLRSRVFGRKEG